MNTGLHCASAAAFKPCGMQACSELPETGVADRSTWQTLLGKDFTPVAPPADVSLASAV